MKKNYKIILSSNSPRRKELLTGLDIDYEIRVFQDIDESYPENIPVMDIAEFISVKKAEAYKNNINVDELIITADTVVIFDENVLGKPKSFDDARRMLEKLSGKTHQVVTGVCLTAADKQIHFSVVTDVTFKELSDAEINYYIEHYKPFDKAGAYGIQEWIGYIGVTSIKGSYFNVMGLPVQRIYQELQCF